MWWMLMWRLVPRAFLASVLAMMAISAAVAQKIENNKEGVVTDTPQPNEKNKDAVLRDTPNLMLTTAQKDTIYTSLSTQAPKNDTAPAFRVAVGETVPVSVELHALPPTLAGLVPQIREFKFAMVSKEILLVDEKSRRVVDVISHAN